MKCAWFYLFAFLLLARAPANGELSQVEYDRFMNDLEELGYCIIPNVIAIVLFGSYGNVYETKQSDLDLAILSQSKLDIVALWDLSQTIAIELNRDVDLIDLRSASTVFRFQVLSTGKLIYCSDQSAFAFFENTAYAMYLNFQETRKEILQDYRDRKVHSG